MSVVKKVLRNIFIMLAVGVLLSPSISYAIGFDAETVYESVMVVHTEDTLGSGFAIGENCIITNAHVIEEAHSISVSTYGGMFYEATVFACDEELDLAVIVVPDADFVPLPIADVDACKIGDDVYTIGAPQSMTYTLTKGVVSAKRRMIGTQEYIQIDAAINAGNSGGPLMNDAGEVLGVNTLKMTDSEGIGLSIPIDIVCNFLTDNNIEISDSGLVVGELDLPAPKSPTAVPFDSTDTGETTGNDTNKANVALIIILCISVSINIVLAIAFVQSKKRRIEPIFDPSERTDFEIDIEE